jgi:hypothetical protein
MYSKKLMFLIVLLGLAVLSQAQNRGFGLGIMLGEPSGLSLKYWTSGSNAITGGIAWSVSKVDGLHLHADYIWHNYRFISVIKGQLPIYYGVGGRLGISSGSNVVGIRGVAGLNYLFDGTPLDIFLELVPVFDIAPKADISFNGAIGIRYFF